ncbi:CGNR zinc finger domain-containing protein [Nonomuraea sediminis]|uniref:CGNR zinc finger domain-containing protein n=1 Tax=Nonomuraea sediminis TaxID=2835864 RepID=UPI001BDBFC8E|nr:CGNR zinc finger domain-containing protein [Nonomuraea sediminis]
MMERPPRTDEPLTGEHLALDLVNTLYATGDHLATLPGLHHWLTLESPRLTPTLPTEPDTRLTGADAQPLATGTRLPDPDAHPSATDAHPTETDARPSDAGAPLTEHDARPSATDTDPTETDDRYSGGDARLAEGDAEMIRDLRAHVSAALAHVRQGTPPPAQSLAAITEAQRAAPTHTTLTWDDGHLTATMHRQGTPGARLAAQLADAAVDLLTGDVTRIRQCEGHDCVMLFIPAHPRRRWCSTTTCGNRARVARHYARHKPT